MKATLPAAIAAELNATMLGRSVLAHADGFMDEGDASEWPDRLRRCMAQVFEALAAEITVLRQEQPNLTAEAFARHLLIEAELEDEAEPEPDEDDDDAPCEWLTHPSLTAEQRNSRS
jgi:hypothetical protein